MVSPVPKEALRWVARAVGPGSAVRVLRRLKGGWTTPLHAVDVRDRRGNVHRLVLRRFLDQEWLTLEPDLVRHEARALEVAERADVPTPRVIAFDETGAEAGAPAVLMTRLRGRVRLPVPAPDEWLTRLARTLAAIHDVDPKGLPWTYRPYFEAKPPDPPSWSRRKRMWEQAIGIFVDGPPDEPQTFIHRDYHPTNVLWLRGRVSGVVDWVNGCRGPRGVDVGHCRWNLAQLYDLATADRFLAAYLDATGGGYDRRWDVIAAVDGEPGTTYVEVWREVGRPDLTDGMVRARVEAFVAAALAEL